jgi:hypothetical protein
LEVFRDQSMSPEINQSKRKESRERMASSLLTRG